MLGSALARPGPSWIKPTLHREAFRRLAGVIALPNNTTLRSGATETLLAKFAGPVSAWKDRLPLFLSRLFLNLLAGILHIFADPASRVPAAHHTQRE
jgi:hypothetical protein